jgi:hypothetical protein
MTDSIDRQHPSRADIYRLVMTSITIFDSAISLLGEPALEGITMPDPAHRACVKKLLESLCGGGGDVES